MNSRVRLAVLLVSAPIVLLVVTGGFLSKASARDDTLPALRVFEEVVRSSSTTTSRAVNSDRIMRGAMHGLAEGLDPDSAYLTPAQATTIRRRQIRCPRAASAWS